MYRVLMRSSALGNVRGVHVFHFILFFQKKTVIDLMDDLHVQFHKAARKKCNTRQANQRAKQQDKKE